MKKTVLLSFLALALFAVEIKKGWNLLGAINDINTSLFNKDFIQIVWKYKDGWSYYSNLQDLSYPKIETVKKGEGFWLKSSKDINTTFYIIKGTDWYWQLQGSLDTNKRALVYDIDLFDNSKETIEELHKKGKIVICYFSAGTYEEWREDKNLFLSKDIGNPLKEWEGEYWVNIKSENIKDIMKKRLDLAKYKGCDGVEPDNVDVYQHNSGFSISYEDQLNYNRFLAEEAHKRGLLIGLKNDIAQIKDLVDFFDFAVNEECWENSECQYYEPFLSQNKAVLNAEYKNEPICEESRLYGISTSFYNIDLDGKYYKNCSDFSN